MYLRMLQQIFYYFNTRIARKVRDGLLRKDSCDILSVTPAMMGRTL
jgi:hypothetical protein